MEPDLNNMDEYIREEEREFNQKKQVNEFKNKIGKQRRNCWWN